MKEKHPQGKDKKDGDKKDGAIGEGDKLWNNVIKEAIPLTRDKHLAPLSPSERRSAAKDKIINKNTPPRKITQNIAPSNKNKNVLNNPSSSQIDKALEQRLLKGELPIDGRIDLHGLTQPQAHIKFTGFITRMISDKARVLLVITGKGEVITEHTKPQRGVLRQKLPLWCDDPNLKPHILKVTGASPKHGGDGAYYILLRRQR